SRRCADLRSPDRAGKLWRRLAQYGLPQPGTGLLRDGGRRRKCQRVGPGQTTGAEGIQLPGGPMARPTEQTLLFPPLAALLWGRIPTWSKERSMTQTLARCRTLFVCAILGLTIVAC